MVSWFSFGAYFVFSLTWKEVRVGVRMFEALSFDLLKLIGKQVSLNSKIQPRTSISPQKPQKLTKKKPSPYSRSETSW